jgi:Asp-tRNA(Asn)/Glu-tRNA(Gln) amidotransferase C subunit
MKTNDRYICKTISLMTSVDLKLEIQKVIDNVPDSVLEEILDYLKQIQNTPPEKVNLMLNLGSILREDKDLLQRLAL